MKIAIDCYTNAKYKCQIQEQNGIVRNITYDSVNCISALSQLIKEYVMGYIPEYPVVEPSGFSFLDTFHGGYPVVKTVHDYVSEINDIFRIKKLPQIREYYTGIDVTEYVDSLGNRRTQSDINRILGSSQHLLSYAYGTVTDNLIKMTIGNREYNKVEKTLLDVREENRLNIGGGLIAYFGYTKSDLSEVTVYVYDMLLRQNIKVVAINSILGSRVSNPVKLYTDGYKRLHIQAINSKSNVQDNTYMIDRVSRKAHVINK